MGPQRIAVLDTNILVSAIGWRGSERRLYGYCQSGMLRPATSSALLAELQRVLRYPKFRFSESEIDAFIKDILEHAIVAEPELTVSVVSAVPDDDRVVECAISANATWIVSGDKHLLALGTVAGVRVVTTAAALQILETLAG